MNRIKDINELIDLLKEDAIKVAVETNVYPSVYIAIAIHEFQKYGEYFIVENKNPYNTFLKENTYFEYADAMRKLSVIFTLYSDKLLTGYNTLKKIYNEDEDTIGNILNIALSYNLNEINKEFIYRLFAFNKNMIDIDRDPKFEIYFVKRFSNSSTLLRTMDLNEAMHVAKKNPGTMIINSKGKKIYGEKDILRKVPKGIKEVNNIKDIYIGIKVNVLGANLYEKSTDTVPIRSISGTYIISSNIKNNKYRISSLNDQSLVVGYVNVNEIEKINLRQ